MTITLRLFASLRERAGIAEITLQLPDNADVAAARDALLQLHPELEGLLKRIAFAVNRSYVPLETTLKEGDEVALIPPVSGG